MSNQQSASLASPCALFSAPAKQLMRQSRRFSWMMSGWLRATKLGASNGGTACLTLGIPDDFYAIRVGFANVSTSAWQVKRAAACTSSQYGNYVVPTGGKERRQSRWTPLTFANRGADCDSLVALHDAPREIVVAGIGDSPLEQAAGVAWTWTDWTPITSQAADPATGLRVVMIRAFVPPNQEVTYANGLLRLFTGNPTLNRGFDVFVGGVKFNRDLVLDTASADITNTQAWAANHVVPGNLFPVVQFLTQQSGIVGMAAGDSHAMGTSSTEQFSGFPYVLTSLLQFHRGNALPFGIVNCAVGGMRSDQFFARFRQLASVTRPSYALLPGWTFNDPGLQSAADLCAVETFFGRLLGTIEYCENLGIVPIILTPFPRDSQSMTADRLQPWRWIRDRILALRGQCHVLDATDILGRKVGTAFDGTYVPDYSIDQIHPNDAGHLAVAMSLSDLLSALINRDTSL